MISPPRPPPPLPPPPAAPRRDSAFANPKGKPATGIRRRAKSPQATEETDAAASLALGRKVALVSGLAAVLFGLVLVIAWFAWPRGGARLTSDDSGERTKPEPPPRVAVPFSVDEARVQQQRWKEFLGEPVEKWNSIGMSLFLIPPGEFEMGTPAEALTELLELTVSPLLQAQYRTESPPTHVTIDSPFYLGAHEVTQAEYEQVMGVNPSWFSKAGEGGDRVAATDAGRLPVEQVSWIDAVEFCNRLSDREHLNRCYLVRDGKVLEFIEAGGYRLPMEAEWEYACRAGSSGKFALPELEQGAWHEARSGGIPCAAGTTQANGFGLFEMHGNVWEWCHNEYSETRPLNPGGGPAAGPLSGDAERAIRGGSWYDEAVDCRSAVRRSHLPTFQGSTLGFRVALSVPGPGK